MSRSQDRDDRGRASTRRQFLERSACAGLGLGVLGALPRSLLAFSGEESVAARRGGDSLSLGNDVISARWSTSGGVLRATAIESAKSNARLAVPEHIFSLALADGTRLDSTRLKIEGEPSIETISPHPDASRFAERLGGRRVTVALRDPDGRIEATWHAELRWDL